MGNNENTIRISVRKKIAKVEEINFDIVGGNSDYKVIFDFDEEWAEYSAKTALFVFGKEPVEVVFEGNTCDGVAIEGATMCLIGAYAGDLETTTPALVSDIKQSIRDAAHGLHNQPTKDVYNQLMDLLNRYINSVKGAPSGGTKGQVLKKQSDADYDYAWENDEMRDLTDYYDKGEIDDMLRPITQEIDGAEQTLQLINDGGIE